MYNDSFSRFKTMGDVDVLWHEGVYHLFHLVLPNHDFVAHAVSEDGLNWDRIENAIFIGHPGTWDDHMLWTMHVSADPHRPGTWRMFYTGLSRGDRGTVQRIGVARSDDLVHWEKVAVQSRGGLHCEDADTLQGLPLVAAPPHYESERCGNHAWVSFRDPFYFRDGERGLLLMSARVGDGPSIRRGCVGLAEEVSPERFRLLPPIHHPGQYDDVEVPNMFAMQGRYYLVGSIREDAKVRYWHAEKLNGPWCNFFDNVLLAEGNYAARLCFDDCGPLLWNFYTPDAHVRSQKNLMPPPKRLAQREDGRLRVKTFEAFDSIRHTVDSAERLAPLTAMSGHRDCSTKFDSENRTFHLRSECGFEGFLFAPKVHCFRFRATLRLDGVGKCGLLFRINPETTDGYFLSLDLLKGIAQLRAWGHRPGPLSEEAFRFKPLQAAYWRPPSEKRWEISLLAVQNYIEFAIEERVLLSLADESYTSGSLGCYVESASLAIEQPTLEHLTSPSKPSYRLPAG